MSWFRRQSPVAISMVSLSVSKNDSTQAFGRCSLLEDAFSTSETRTSPTDFLVLHHADGDVLDLHVALIHLQRPADAVAHADPRGTQMAGDVHLGDEVDVARAQKTVEIVDVVLVQDEIRRRRQQCMLCHTRTEDSLLLSPPHSARSAICSAAENILQPDGTRCAD